MTPSRSPLRSTLRSLRRFLRDERGNATVETVLVFPMLAWAYLGTFTFFDGFRAQAINVKTAYTIGDILSRQVNDVTAEFVDSMYALQGTISSIEGQKRLRVTSFVYDQAQDKMLVQRSEARGAGLAKHTTASLAALRSRIPTMANGEVGILTETWAIYVPPMDVGIDPLIFSEVVVTRPRFALANRFCWNTVNDTNGGPTRVC